MVWNKVYRRRFWQQHDLAFPAMRYEDAPVTVLAHLLAECVDIVSTDVYYWRRREQGPPSITQRMFEPGNLTDRVRMVQMTGEIIATRAPQLKADYDRDMCAGNDLRAAVLGARLLEPDDFAPTLSTAQHYLAAVDETVLADLPAPHRRNLQHLLAGRPNEISNPLPLDGEW